MKQKISILMLLMLLFTALMPLTAQAAGNPFLITGKNVIVEEVKDGVNVYVFARLENRGKKTLSFESGRFDVYNKEGELLGSDEHPAVFAAKYLTREKYGYLRAYVSLEGVKAEEIGECTLTVEGKEYKGKAKIVRLDCETQYEENVRYGGWLTYDYMGVKVTNNTDAVLYDMEAVIVLCAEDGTILNIGYAFMGLLNDIGLHPGSTVTMRDINADSMQEAYKKAGYEVSYMDAIVYVEIYG